MAHPQTVGLHLNCTRPCRAGDDWGVVPLTELALRPTVFTLLRSFGGLATGFGVIAEPQSFGGHATGFGVIAEPRSFGGHATGFGVIAEPQSFGRPATFGVIAEPRSFGRPATFGVIAEPRRGGGAVGRGASPVIRSYLATQPCKGDNRVSDAEIPLTPPLFMFDR